jgi:hypothetical protein
VWNGCAKILKALVLFFKIIINPALLLPLLYNIILIAVPNLGDVGNFILLNKGGWSLEQVSYVTLSTGVFFAFFMIWFLGACMPKMPFYVSYIIGSSGLVITNMMFYLFIDPIKIGFWRMFAIYWIQTMISNFTGNLPNLATIGRFTTYMPEGFESTGVTILVATMNMGVLSSGLLAAAELKAFNVVDGYYDRVTQPITINCMISIGVCILCPLFIAWKVKGLAKSHGAIENADEEEKKIAADEYKTMAKEEYEQIEADD